MKYLLIIAIVVAVIWLTRALRGKPEPPTAPPRTPQTPSADGHEEMIACTHCGIHLPRSEATPGAAGALYCGDPHRLAHERADAGR